MSVINKLLEKAKKDSKKNSLKKNNVHLEDIMETIDDEPKRERGN